MTFTPILIGSGFLGFQSLKSTEEAQRRAHSGSVEVAREREYAATNLSTIATSDELLADRRLLEVALTAYGLEDQLDNTAFVKRVLDEGTADERAFANLLNDPRWVDFSRDMGFGPSGGGGSSDVDGFGAIVANRFRNQAAEEEPGLDPFDLAHFRSNIGSITTVDELLADPLTLEVALKSFGLERGYYNDDHFRQLLTEGVDDTVNDYAFTLDNPVWASFATAFSGLGDGLPINQVSPFRLDVERELVRRGVTLYDNDEAAASATRIGGGNVNYFQQNADAITSASDLVGDEQLRDVTLAAYGLLGTSVSDADITAMLDAAVAGDLSLAEAQSNSAWRQLAESFAASVNAGDSGDVPYFQYIVELGIAEEGLEQIDSLEPEDNSISEVDQEELDYFIKAIGSVEDVDAFLEDDRLLQVGLAAFGLENENRSKSYLRDILTEDVESETAFVNALSDTRWKDFASAFQGVGAQQAIWQSEIEERLIALEAPQEDIDYLRSNWRFVDENLDLVLFPELLDVVLSAFELPKDSFTPEFFTSMIISDPNEKNAFVNLYDDDRWKDLVNLIGNFANTGSNLKDEDYVSDVIDRYESRSFEIAVGEQNQDMRIALNFENQIGEFADRENWFAVLGDEPLRAVMDKVFSAPEGFINLEIEQQNDWYMTQSRLLFGDATPKIFADEDRIDDALRRYLATIDNATTGGISLTTPGYGAISMLSTAASNARSGFGRF